MTSSFCASSDRGKAQSHRRRWARQQEKLFDGQVSGVRKSGLERPGASAWGLGGITEGGAGRDLRGHQLGHFAGEEMRLGEGGVRSGS